MFWQVAIRLDSAVMNGSPLNESENDISEACTVMLLRNTLSVFQVTLVDTLFLRYQAALVSSEMSWRTQHMKTLFIDNKQHRRVDTI